MATPNVNPFAAKKSISFCDTIVASGTSVYDPDSDKVLIGFSVGNGKGVAKVEIPHDQIANAYYALVDWKPGRDLTPCDMINRTIEYIEPGDGEATFDPYVSFKVSAKKNARTVNVPASEWEAFLSLMNGLRDSAYDLADNARAAYEEVLKEEAAKK
jgi:hypothetical protein